MRTAQAVVRHPVVAAIVGVVAGALTIALVEWAGHQWLGPAPAGAIAPSMFALVLAGWLLGAWVAGRVGAAWASRGRLPGVAGGLVLLAGAAATMVAIPHPWWVVAVALAGMPAAAWWGARRAAGR